ncbi:site-specific integrase [Alicycliphilus denitrificans]|uniref:Site-specific integrase n=1 Tax=Alicycliphilus denitrificans TaxID=179636 RepID=A0A858ZXL9_9BURK|nr:tyrosine-type recombinase/integrase [Alicycliphilus denitrificans]QKD45740.1 site-specific integrase [Alicycliphilus denitrificans]
MRKSTAPKPPSFAALVQQFFTEYLVAQRAASPRTVACYRDALMLFLDFACDKLGKLPTALRLADIKPDLILAFLDHLEQQRHNAVRSRNLRLTALRAFLKFAGRRDVTSLHDVERALSIPMKRFEQPMLGFLSRAEMVAVLGQPGASWTSQRDHLLLTLLYNTGARVSEIIGVRVVDVVLDGGACVHLHGKGRKLRSIPLWHATVVEIRAWLRLNPTLRSEAPLLPNRDGWAMSRSNVAQRLNLAVARAAIEQPSLLGKHVSPHTLRHTSAMHLLQSGVPFNVIALWLGHESTVTTHRYVQADLAMKEKALARLEEPSTKLRRYRPPDSLMRFLQEL